MITAALERRFGKYITYWAPVVFWMLFIAWMSTPTFSSENTSQIIEPILRYVQPTITQPDIDWYHYLIRKSAHLTEYCILGLLLFRAFKSGSGEKKAFRWAASAFIVIALYALSDEFHQSFSPERTASMIDVVIDSLGGFVGVCAAALFHTFRRQ